MTHGQLNYSNQNTIFYKKIQSIMIKRNIFPNITTKHLLTSDYLCS